MLSFLLDEHISVKVAEQMRAKRADIPMQTLQEWREGRLLRQEDPVILAAAQEDGLTLVTYDQKTITPLVVQWMLTGRPHAGVLFVDDRSIPQYDIGGILRALIAYWDTFHLEDWTNRVGYLTPAEE
jgi:hypothetical protein